MSGRLEGVRAIVTGGSRGLGRAVAEGFAAEGARVVVTATQLTRVAGTVERLQAQGAEAHGIALELGDLGSVAAAAAAAIAALGRVDVLVNGASMLGTRTPLAEQALDTWQAVMGVNVTGTLALTQAILPAMSQGGAIIMVSSGAAGRAGWGAYGVSKLALDGITAMLREELAPTGIRAVAVNPGGLRTAMRAAAYPQEDPATVPHPSSVVEAFIAIAEGADPGPRIDAAQWSPR